MIDPLPAPHAERKVEEFRRAMLGGASFPPISGVRVGRKFIIADGHKRFAAYQTLDQHLPLRVEVWPLRRWLADQWRQARKTLRRAAKAVRELRHQGLSSHEARDLAIGTLRHYRRILTSVLLLAKGLLKRLRPACRRRILDAVDVPASLALRWIARSVALLPRPQVAKAASILGGILFLVLRGHRRSALQNLAAIRGNDWSAPERYRVARTSFANLLRTEVLLLCSQRFSASDMRELVDFEAEDLQLLQSIQRRGKGLILATAHFGEWELGAQFLGAIGLPMSIEACAGEGEVSPLRRSRRISDFLWSLRGISGNRRAESVDELVPLVLGGGTAGLLVDLNGSIRGSGEWVEFLGLPSYTKTSAGELARRTGAPLVFCCCRPRAGGRAILECFEIDYSRAATSGEISRLCLQAAERQIELHPELWLWCYRKWRRRPTPEVDRYPAYSRHREIGNSWDEVRAHHSGF